MSQKELSEENLETKINPLDVNSEQKLEWEELSLENPEKDSKLEENIKRKKKKKSKTFKVESKNSSDIIFSDGSGVIVRNGNSYNVPIGGFGVTRTLESNSTLPFHLSQGYLFPVRPSPFDPRGENYEVKRQMYLRKNKLVSFSSIRSPPDSLDLSDHLKWPRDQGRRGTCVAFSCSAIKEYHEKLDSNFNGYMSPESVYFFRSTKPDEGMFASDAMKILSTKGICTEEKFRYSSVEPLEITLEAREEMGKFKIKSYAKIDTIDGVKDALFNNGPCLACFPVYDGSPEFWRKTKPESPMYGGHAVAIVGYNKTGFILRNSWGIAWNRDGHVIYPYADWGRHWEIWSSVDDESNYVFPKRFCDCLPF